MEDLMTVVLQGGMSIFFNDEAWRVVSVYMMSDSFLLENSIVVEILYTKGVVFLWVVRIGDEPRSTQLISRDFASSLKKHKQNGLFHFITRDWCKIFDHSDQFIRFVASLMVFVSYCSGAAGRQPLESMTATWKRLNGITK